MNLKSTFDISIKLLKQVSKDNPGKSFTNSQGERASLEDVIASLKKLSQWVLPSLDSNELVKVTRCKDCIYFKTYKKKDDPKARPFQACSSNRSQRDPMFFCKNGEHK